MKTKTKEKNSDKLSHREFLKRSARRACGFVKNRAEGFFSKYSDMLCEEVERESADTRERVRLFVTSILLSFLALILSRTEFSDACFPLSVSILCATGVKSSSASFFTPRLIMALSMGAVMVSCLFMGSAGVLYFATLTTLFIIRCVLTHGEFSESDTHRTLASFFTALLLGFMGALVSDFALLSLVAWVTLVTLCPIFTYLFSTLFDSLSRDGADSITSERREVAWLSVAFCSVFALSGIRFISLSLAVLLSYCVTMCVSKKYGVVKGAIVGLVLGSACGESVYAASFGIAGLVAGLFFSLDLTALLVSVLVITVVSVYLGGTQGFLTTLPEVMTGFLIVFPILPRLEGEKKKITLLSTPRTFTSASRAGRKLERMSNTFFSLSEVFFAVSESFREPNREGVKTIVENSCNSVCVSCSLSHKCWGRQWRDTSGTLEALADSVMKKGKLELDDFPEYFRARCPKSEEICEGVNSRSKLALFKKGALDSANVIAGEYRTVSKLLKNTAESFSHIGKEDETLSVKAQAALRSLGIEYGFVESWGGRCSVVDVVGVRPEKISKSALDIISSFENKCSVMFEEPEFITGEKNTVMRMRRRRALHLECAKNSCSKKGESVNGDSVSFFESDEGYFYALIADGMGSGREAALTSRLASVFLEKLLVCTDDKSTTLEMLNRMLVSKEDECFTTVDLLEIDLFEKRASFIKAGAVDSYIIRGDKVYVINSATVPAGIIDELRCEQTRTHLAGGDVVVLLSDGALGEEGFDVGSLVIENKGLSAGELSRKLLSAALSRFRARDDMSVAVIKVFEE